MLDREQIAAFDADARIETMISDARRALAYLDEMAAHLPAESREARCVASAAGSIGALIVLLGAAVEDGAKLPPRADDVMAAYIEKEGSL